MFTWKDWKLLLLHPRGPSLLELARQVFSSTESGYDLLAEKFEFTPFRTPEVVLKALDQTLAELGEFQTALDVCCGTGLATRVLLDHANKRVVGLDISDGMMEIARQKLSLHSGPNKLEFLKKDMMELPSNEEFDLVTNFGGLGHVKNKDVPRFLYQVYAALRPGGRFIFVTCEYPPVSSFSFWRAHAFNLLMRIRNFLFRPTFDMYYLTFMLPRVKELLQSAGFTVEVRSDLFPEPHQDYRMVIATRKT